MNVKCSQFSILRVSFTCVPALFSSFILMKGNKCTMDFHSWGGRLLRGKLKPTWESLNSMPWIHSLVPNRDGILHAVPYLIHILLLAWKSFWETNPQLLKIDIISLKWNNLPLKCFYPKARVTVWQLRCLWSTPNYLGPCCWTFIWILFSFAYPLTILLLMPPPIASLADRMVGCGFTSSSFKRQVEGLLELEP